VTGWHKLVGFVNVARGFDGMPAVINAASDLLIELWGDAGRHARSAIGVAQLPFGWPVEIEAVVEVRT
jgi:enamine deaminase RidA (YjgF/YER057c/UK114 family)